MKKSELIRYVESIMGAPVINIEVTVEQVEVIIKDCVEEYRDYLCCSECYSNRDIYDILEFRELVVAKVGIQWWKHISKFIGTMPDGFEYNMDGIYQYYSNELSRIRYNMYN